MPQDIPPHPDDVVLCSKQYWSDNVLAQPPTLLLPHAYMPKLSKAPTIASETNEMSSRQLREYRKTAEQVDTAPWSHG